MRIARAEDTDRDLQAVLGLIEEARTWLGTKGTNQWASPWPDLKRRDARVRRGLAVGKTWIVWEGEVAVATITIATRPNAKVWYGRGSYDLSERAVYAHRLITTRKYAGYGLGAQLIDWAGLGGDRDYGAKWIRIDVWTKNEELHNYYQQRGFTRCGTCPDPGYPSGALFQKPVSAIQSVGIPLVEGSSAEFDVLDLRPFDIDLDAAGTGPDVTAEQNASDQRHLMAFQPS
jgi:GNAT superfamily N-acetyltransferase